MSASHQVNSDKGVSVMGILRRTFVMMVAGCILAGGTEAFAKGPRILLNATLSPASGAPASAKGKAKFDQSASRTNFSVEAENLRSLNGKVVSIFVDGTLVGNKTVALGRIKLELTNQRGGSVPVVAKGTIVELKVGSALLLGGAF